MEFCPLRQGKFAELLLNYRLQMRGCGCNWEAPNANKMHENRSVRIGQVELANRRIQPLCHLSAVWFLQFTTILRSACWPISEPSGQHFNASTALMTSSINVRTVWRVRNALFMCQRVRRWRLFLKARTTLSLK